MYMISSTSDPPYLFSSSLNSSQVHKFQNSLVNMLDFSHSHADVIDVDTDGSFRPLLTT